MATGVGLRIAEDECLAAIVNSTTPEPGAPAPEPLFVVREPILYMSEDGDTELGGDPPAGNAHSITGFVAAVGDPAGISVDEGEAYRAEDLVATALFCLIDLAAAHLNGPAEFYAVHPAHWPAAQVLALRDALDYLGLRSVVLLSESILPDVHSGREVATAAARGALASVLSTPAGAAPPDPTRTENSLESTDILPAIPTPSSPAQAYSAAIPVHAMARSITSPADADADESSEPPATKLAPSVVLPPAARSRRTPLLIAAAAFIGLLLGGIVVALALQGSGSASPSDARSRSTPTTAPVTTRVPATVLAPPATTREPAQIPVHRPAPQATTPPPPATTTPPLPGTTTPEPTPTTATPSRPWRTPTTQSPFNPYNFDPFDPNTYDPFYPTNPTAPTAPYVWSPPAGNP